MSSNKSDFLCFRAVCSNRATAIEMDGSADRFLQVLDLLGRQKVSSSHIDRQQNVPHVQTTSQTGLTIIGKRRYFFSKAL